MTSEIVTEVPVQNVSVIPQPGGPIGYMLFNDHIATATTMIQATPDEVWAVLVDPAKAPDYFLGAEIETSARVRELIIERGRAAGVTLQDGRALRADAVISGINPKLLYTRMIPADALPKPMPLPLHKPEPKDLEPPKQEPPKSALVVSGRLPPPQLLGELENIGPGLVLSPDGTRVVGPHGAEGRKWGEGGVISPMLRKAPSSRRRGYSGATSRFV